jgi:hypothetical protein
MLITFFGMESLVHHEFPPQGQNLNETVYRTFLQCLRNAVHWKWPHKWFGTWLLHHKNDMPCGPACQGILGQAQHPNDSPSTLPHLAPCNFFLFPKLNSTLKGKWLQDIAEIQLNTTQQLQTIPKQAYHTCIEKWKDHWNHCIQSARLYFEGDNSE